MTSPVRVAVLLLALLVATHSTAVGAIRRDPVRVDLYVEALCPYCANFTVTQIAPMFKNKLINFVELDVIPWGNARADAKSGVVACQHGELECQLNKLIGCAVAQHPLQDDWFPFLHCVEEVALEQQRDKIVVEEVAHQCAVHAGMPTARLMGCYNGELGNALQRLASQRTASLKPPHQYVPWIVVNGIPLLDDMDNIVKYICVAYTGSDRPKLCYDAPPTPSATANQLTQKMQEKAAQAPFKPCRREHFGAPVERDAVEVQ